MSDEWHSDKTHGSMWEGAHVLPSATRRRRRPIGTRAPRRNLRTWMLGYERQVTTSIPHRRGLHGHCSQSSDPNRMKRERAIWGKCLDSLGMFLFTSNYLQGKFSLQVTFMRTSEFPRVWFIPGFAIWSAVWLCHACFQIVWPVFFMFAVWRQWNYSCSCQESALYVELQTTWPSQRA
jgi:hypothetical protein